MRLVGYLHETIGVAEGDAITHRFWPKTHPQPTKAITIIDELIADAESRYLPPSSTG